MNWAEKELAVWFRRWSLTRRRLTWRVSASVRGVPDHRGGLAVEGTGGLEFQSQGFGLEGR